MLHPGHVPWSQEKVTSAARNVRRCRYAVIALIARPVSADPVKGRPIRLASCAVSITPADTALARINAPYAHTYLVEDSYLATLAADLGSGDFGNLPDTQDQQRLAIIEWRVQLQLAAAQVGYLLPADIQQAGRRRDRPQPHRQLTLAFS